SLHFGPHVDDDRPEVATAGPRAGFDEDGRIVRLDDRRADDFIPGVEDAEGQDWCVQPPMLAHVDLPLLPRRTRAVSALEAPRPGRADPALNGRAPPDHLDRRPGIAHREYLLMRAVEIVDE